MASWAADPKPVRRHKATPAEKRELDRAFEHACCVKCGIAYQHKHHIVFRGADSGDDVLENLAPMCNSCHDRFHGRAGGWERVSQAIRNYIYQDPGRLAYVLERLGQDRLDRRYPPLASQCARVVYRDFGNWAQCHLQRGHRGECAA